jgi:hypothetical protein
LGEGKLAGEQCETGKLRTSTPEPFTGDNVKIFRLFLLLPPH